MPDQYPDDGGNAEGAGRDPAWRGRARRSEPPGRLDHTATAAGDHGPPGRAADRQAEEPMMTDKVPWREIPCSEQCWAIYATVRKLHSVVSRV